MSFIPLLSVKDLRSFTPEEFKAHVRRLFAERRARKKAAPKKKKLRDFKLTIKRTKKGKISIRSKRNPKYFTPEELTHFAKVLETGENELFIHLKEKDFFQATHEEAEKVKKYNEEIPWR